MLRTICCLLLLAAAARPGYAAPTVYLSRAPACPSAELLREALRAHLSRFEVTTEPVADSIPLEVLDLGARYRVVVGGVARDFDDAGRDCAERAAAATVFAALILEPPAVEEPAPSVDAAAAASSATGTAAATHGAAAAPPRSAGPVGAPADAPRPSLPRSARLHRLELQWLVGSGIGYVPAGAHTDVAWSVTRTPGNASPAYARAALGSGGAAYAPLHVGLAAQLRLSRRFSVGLFARVGFPLLDNADSTADPPLGSGSAHAIADFALLARARVLLGDGRVHPFFTLGLGGGWIDHAVDVTAASRSSTPTRPPTMAAPFPPLAPPSTASVRSAEAAMTPSVLAISW
jgi:hypothetical protein